MDPVDMLDFLIIIGVHIVDPGMENVLLLTVHHIVSTMNAPPKMFVGAAILRVHTL